MAHLVLGELGGLWQALVQRSIVDEDTMPNFMSLDVCTETKSKSFGSFQHCLAVPSDWSEIQDSRRSRDIFEILASIL